MWWRSFITSVLVGTFLHVCVAVYYAPGTTYHYEYNTIMSLGEPYAKWTKMPPNRKGNSVGLRLHTNVALTAVWEKADAQGKNRQIIKMTLSDTHLTGSLQINTTRRMPQLERYPIHFLWLDNSLVKDVYAVDNDTSIVQSIKRGIIGLLQVKPVGTSRLEKTPAGQCRINYTDNASFIQKKQVECVFPSEEGQFTNAVPMLNVKRSSQMNSLYVTEHDVIVACTCIHSTRFMLPMENSIRMEAVASQDMQFMKKTTSEEEMLHGDDPFEAISEYGLANDFNIPAKLLYVYGSSKKLKKYSTLQLADILNSNRENLLPEKTGKVETSEAFLSLVASLRTASEQSILDVLQDSANQDVILALIDTVAATQTAASHSALMKYLKFEDESTDEINERFLLASAFATHPSTELLNDLVKLSEKTELSDRLQKAVAVSLGAVLYTYSRQEIFLSVYEKHVKMNAIEQLINETEMQLLNRLYACTESACQLLVLQTLANAGLNTTAVPLVRLAEKSTDMAVVEACLKALRRMPASIFKDVNVRNPVKRIFFQSRRLYDSAVRSQALTQLLRHDLDQDDLLDIVMVTADTSNQEFALYTQARLLDLMSSNAKLRKKMKAILRDVKIANYNIFAAKGKSIAFSSKLVETPSILANYFMYVENSKSGVMKRSGMDVTAGVEDITMPISTFNIFSAGLESMLGEEVPEGQEEIEPTAGMSLDLLGVGLPPITFFTGQTNLLSAVWSAPSTLQSALKANLLLQDYHRFVTLRNGFVAKVDIQGALSVDLSGSLSVSLWNKNAKSLIRNSGAFAVKGSIELDTTSFMASISHSARAENVIDFQTDVDFYSAVKLCLQMSQQNSAYSHNVTRFESLKGTKKGVRIHLRKSSKMPDVSFPLPESNSRQCKTLLAEQ